MSVLASPEYVSAGARMTWTGQFSYGANSLQNELLSSSPYDALNTIGAYLKNSYQIAIERSDNGVSWWSGNGSITLYLRTDMDRGDGESDDGLTDIGNNVEAAFQSQGFPCTAWAISSYTPAPTVNADGSTSNPATVNTGTAQTTVAQQQAAAASNPSAASSWWNSLTSNLESGSIGVVIGVGLAAVLLVVLISRPSVTAAA